MAKGDWRVLPTRQEEQAADGGLVNTRASLSRALVQKEKKGKGLDFSWFRRKAMEVLMRHGAEYGAASMGSLREDKAKPGKADASQGLQGVSSFRPRNR